MSSEQHNSLGLLCRHHRIVRIAPEPGFASACAIGYQVSPWCQGQRICDCRGYEADSFIAAVTGTPGATTQMEPAVCVEGLLDTPHGEADGSQGSRIGLLRLLDRASAWVWRMLPRLHIEDDRSKV